MKSVLGKMRTMAGDEATFIKYAIHALVYLSSDIFEHKLLFSIGLGRRATLEKVCALFAYPFCSRLEYFNIFYRPHQCLDLAANEIGCIIFNEMLPLIKLEINPQKKHSGLHLEGYIERFFSYGPEFDREKETICRFKSSAYRKMEKKVNREVNSLYSCELRFLNIAVEYLAKKGVRGIVSREKIGGAKIARYLNEIIESLKAL